MCIRDRNFILWSLSCLPVQTLFTFFNPVQFELQYIAKAHGFHGMRRSCKAATLFIPVAFYVEVKDVMVTCSLLTLTLVQVKVDPLHYTGFGKCWKLIQHRLDPALFRSLSVFFLIRRSQDSHSQAKHLHFAVWQMLTAKPSSLD